MMVISDFFAKGEEGLAFNFGLNGCKDTPPKVEWRFIISNSSGVSLPGFRSMASGMPTFPIS